MENEKISDEELQKLVLEAQKEALQNEQMENEKRRRHFPKLLIWIITICLVINTFAFLPEKFSLPAIKFLITSAKLSQQKNIQQYKQAVVVVAADESRGTGFSISSDGTIMTNYHVIEGKSKIFVSFPEEGPFPAQIIDTFPSIDLAILKIDENRINFPFLTFKENRVYESGEEVIFIGNPLRFQGIVNEGTMIDKITLRSWKEEVVMIKAPVYRGNSGSPVLNQKGEVIGVIFATIDHAEHGKVGLFVPIDLYFKKLKRHDR